MTDRHSYWLLKTEPQTYSFHQLIKDKKTNWNGVRNFQARNYLRAMKRGDLALIYHSGAEKAVIGVAVVAQESYPDIDLDHPGDWVQVDIKASSTFKTPVPLSLIKRTEALADIALIKQSRLSVMPVSLAHYKNIFKLGSREE